VLFIPICQAVQHAHQKGIIHRDIKPSNILVTLHDGVPVPKVIDFGIAKATEGRLTDATVYTQLHQFIGTPVYVSPEQAEMSGLDVDTRSDIYSLGVLLYELLTGKTPFDPNELMSQGIDSMRKTIREKEPVRPSTKLATLQGDELTTTAKRRSVEVAKLSRLLKGDLDWIVMKCLEKDRTRRYETANGLAADLKRHLTNEPIVARPPSTLYRVQKTVRRNKLVFAAGAIVASAIIIGFVVSASSFLKEREARRLAVRAEQKAESALQHEASLRQRAEESSVAAEKAARETSRALADSDFQQALRLLEENKSRNALAYLARSLSLSATSAVASRLASLLANRSWMAPTIVATNSSVAAFSPDGKQVATADLDGFIRVWDSTSGEEILKPLFLGDEIKSLVYSGDGKYLLGRSTTKARSWDTETGREFAVSAPLPAPITATDSSKDGRLSAIGFSDGTVWLLESATLKVISDKIKYENSIEFLRFSRDGTKLLANDYDNVAGVWDVQTGTRLTPPLKQHMIPFRLGDLSPDCSKAATADGQAVKIWDLSSGTVAAVFTHSNWVSAIEFGPDGKQLLTAAGDGTARLSDAATGNMVRLLSHDSAVLRAQFSPDGQWVLTTCADESAHLWDARTGRQITEALSHAGGGAFFSPDGLRIVTVSAQKAVRLWAFVGAPQLPVGFVSAPNSANEAQLSPDGKRVAVAYYDGTIRFYDAASARPLSTSLTTRIGTFINHLVFSPDGSRLVAAPPFGPAEIWDVKTGKMLAGSIPNASFSAPCFSPDGSRLLTWSISNSARIWDARNGKPVGAPLQHKDRVGAAEFSPDGRLVVTVSEDRTRRVWQTETGEPFGPSLVVQENDFGNGLARFSPDGERIATTDGGILRIFETKTGSQLPITIRHVKSISSVEFSRDGRRILTASNDGSARIWEADSGQPLAPPMNHAGQVKLAGFSPIHAVAVAVFIQDALTQSGSLVIVQLHCS
jgi:WD40 repeat protein